GDRVGAGAAEQHVAARAAEEVIVAGAADEGVVAAVAGDGVIAFAGVGERVAGARAEGDRVIPAVRPDRDALELRRRERSANTVDVGDDASVARAAVDGDGVLA